MSFSLEPSRTALLIVDMQEKVLAAVEKGSDVLLKMRKIVKGFQILNLPIFISEQYPKGLGETTHQLKELLGSSYQPWIKSTFSCLGNRDFFNHVMTLPYSQWVIGGIEAHICVLQTVKELLQAGKQVVVLKDATTSRSADDSLVAIEEMRAAGARISVSETVFCELIKDSKHPSFKSISALMKAQDVF